MHPLYTEAVKLFDQWFKNSETSVSKEPNLMHLATANASGRPSGRYVLLKHYNEYGFMFFTHRTSRKGQEISENPYAAITMHWDISERQIRIEGKVEALDIEAADNYFASRRKMSQIGAWASDQSQPLDDYSTFEQAVEKFSAKFANRDVPRPPNWIGYKLVPDRFEFWQGMEFRLHKRTVYSKRGDRWHRGMLYP